MTVLQIENTIKISTLQRDIDNLEKLLSNLYCKYNSTSNLTHKRREKRMINLYEAKLSSYKILLHKLECNLC